MKAEKTYPYQLGLVLSGGGAKGLAHLGILQALEERGIRPDIISGTSAGAFAGVLYCDGYKPAEILDFFKNTAFKEFAKLTIPQAGFFKTDPFESFLKKHLRAKVFDDLLIPLSITTTNIENGASVHFTTGELIPAVLASCSIPVLFNPIKIDGVHYMDGGLFKNFPVSVIRKKCEKIIGANVLPAIKDEYKNNLLHIAERSFYYMSISNTMSDRKLCDVLIECLDAYKYSMFGLDHVDEIFQIGYEAATTVLDKMNKEQLAEVGQLP